MSEHNYDPLVQTGVTPSLDTPQTYWHSTHQCAQQPSLSEQHTCDYLVIGGGYTGLSAAMALAEYGKDVTVIDSQQPGFGCAGRNAGFVLSGSGRLSLSAIEDKWDKTVAQGMRNEFDAAVSLLKDRIDRYDMQVDYVTGPYVKLAHSAKHARLLLKSATTAQDSYGVPFIPLSHGTVASRFGVQGMFGGIQVEGACIHPLKLVDEYTKVATSTGANLFYNTPALSITEPKQNRDSFKVATPKGDIYAQHILIASNAYTPIGFHNSVNERQFPVQSSIFVTAPLTEEQIARTKLSSPVSFMDTRMMKYYYRVLPDGRLLFGGRGAVAGKNANSNSEKQRLYKAMLKSFPALENIDVEYFWSGWVSVSLDSLPRIFTQNDNRIGYAMGYCGSGVSFAAYAGNQLAKRMLDQPVNDQLPIYKTPLPKYPFPQLRRTALRALYQWARVFE